MSTFKHEVFKRVCLLLASACLLSAGFVFADERILDYHSDILIHADGSLMVTETIRVQAEGSNIRRGIFRDFPTRYEDRYKNHYRVSLDVLDVQRNGTPETCEPPSIPVRKGPTVNRQIPVSSTREPSNSGQPGLCKPMRV